MARLSAHGRELDRWFDFDRRAIFALREDGVTLTRSLYSGWTVWSRFNRNNTSGHTLSEYLERTVQYHNRVADCPRHGIQCRCDPPHDLRAWGKAGRPGDCPCPNPQPYETGPRLTRNPDYFRLPSLDTLRSWECDAGCEAPCGCSVEPDGYCGQHNQPSWLRILGMI